MEDVQWYTREEAETSEEHGAIPEKRGVEELMEKGFAVIDKPYGPTSKQVSTWIKEELDLKKAGHFGTLDPNATGVLPVGLNSGTRINNALSSADKEYVFEAELTQDRAEEDIAEVMRGFRGTNKQVPPERSAVKREERERELYEIELLDKKDGKILGKVRCESGFYVRVLIEQIGDELEVGAEMTELRRTSQGPINEEDAHTLQDLVDAYHYYREDGEEERLEEILQPIETGVRHLRKIAIKDSAVNAVANGADLGCTGISKLQDGITEGEKVAVMTLKGELVSIATAQMSSEEMYDGEGTAAVLENVYMDPETYPRRWKQ
ncbi:MAG: RNA-guided pseudouridylation complex pseudouridine synthase subunit Cbf5 [Candidatus Nanohaloarchaea archaeon]